MNFAALYAISLCLPFMKLLKLNQFGIKEWSKVLNYEGSANSIQECRYGF